jgi:HSP20 family protein
MNLINPTPVAARAPQAAATSQPATDPRPVPALRPPVDVLEDAAGITLLADMPGVPRDRLQLHIDGDQLHIEGAMVLPVPTGMNAHHAEVRQAAYRRAFTLSKELDPNGITAELAHGVLRVRIPKAAHAQPRRIAVQVA